jgi:hypothetical protein
MVPRVGRNAADIAACHGAGLLQALLMAVVAMLAQCLVIALVPEFLLIATVRLDVIHHGGWSIPAALEALDAQRMLAEITVAVTLPPATIPALGCGWTLWCWHRAIKKPA